MKEIFIKNEKEMVEFGKKIATDLKGGDILCLYGDLGVGKTTLTKGIAQVFGIKQRIKSPTFTLFNVYNVQIDGKRIKFVHIDAYRLNSPKELLVLDWDKTISDPKNIIFIEWPEIVKEILPENHIKINFKFISENEREIEI